ncbi:MAG: 1-deoxy-D-xylulose-5-phosphate reductoisomerase [Pseudomonadales bacterium]|jgi:1-deoxy-D-xylulose-5-phosphate reductoisomerase|uniref:1-deoxy-D-xylulose-5-phosphate reductoisomerase n=1 Tax=unclassified Ketobacter TaxID=2639109 RepID=UPI000C4EEEFC|nr:MULTISPECIES: 1-deoxy-D-xylulose-5-phosphate reductoisomerase [unclassified Ketobacter]MAQ25078.1 1-deoxy-D-xylulose-5-phosphate reductoisomerase [Pseudomonadales bacterium]MEC8814103.1 1-deoxy-D-xylulose-5-phosphate reductoisomerase [Pseudomonadota bacterium]TNC89691.1 MAG: 1-deoxy-D-xylulose-5-phosphate reductoisomerase [Alcanivorax sp.]HAG95386.1 1-deoxy-D-xylulose-5-phosphate reductoisomerase [Gammaproteobacteria bacterium]MBI26928.1 1-deoxy-D-xylulose-5-phosphate reductoisomerase [Pseu|tara:strand:- start:1380 stop:2570 length:1191 start_codon:yes stop_codon:yes gene_type:complete
MSTVQNITVLGSTGSIGVSTLDVLRQHRGRYRAFALTAHTNVDDLFRQVLEFMPRYAVLLEDSRAEELRNRLRQAGSDTEVLAGMDGLVAVAEHADVDQVMAAIVGAAGLLPTLAAVRSGKRVLLANKEALVMSGQLFMSAVKRSGAELLPIDSEHNAIFQCMPVDFADGLGRKGVSRILLTGSGGPFRQLPLAQFAEVTPEQACAHPNWSMGRKISVDSATMMNKGLEFIEACWLFSASVDQVQVVVHPQSVIHSMVQYVDGSVLAQMGNPDMRTPIAFGLGWPERIASGVAPLDLVDVARLDFQQPDEGRFPCLRLAREAMMAGKTASVVLNAANEVAVDAFLAGRVRFTAIPAVIESVLGRMTLVEAVDIDTILRADQAAREMAHGLLTQQAK